MKFHWLVSFIAFTVFSSWSMSSIAGNQLDQPIVAVFGMEYRGKEISKELLVDLTAYLAAKLTEGGYQVIPPDQMKNRLRSQKNTGYEQCYDQSCQIEIGRELSAQKSLSSRVMKIGTICQLTATLYDLRKSTTELAATAKGKCGDEALLESVEMLAAKLCAPRRAEKKESAKALSDFDVVLKKAQKIKVGKERVKNSWLVVSKMARDTMIPKQTRAELLKKFLAEYQEYNPYKDEVKKLLSSMLPSTLVVRTDPPGASVSVNGESKGNSPIQEQLTAGNYTVRVLLAGHDPHSRSVTLEYGRTTEMNFKLQKIVPTALVVRTDPVGATVSVNGESIGKSPIQGQLPAGKYTVQVLLAGYEPQSRSVTLEDRKITEMMIELQRILPATLVINTIPSGSLVSISGKQFGKAPVTVELGSGRHFIEVSSEGYDSESRGVEVFSGKKTEISFSLSRNYPMNPYKKWGHVTLWSGIGLAAFGGVSAYMSKAAADAEKDGEKAAGDRSQTWAGMMWAGLGAGSACIITGVILWSISPGDKAWSEKQSASVTAIPTPDGLVFSVSGRW